MKWTVFASLLVAGCATGADNISAAYVSPMLYRDYNCQQLAEEATRLSNRAATVAGVQNQKATGDAIATGVGVVIFWPALLFIKGDGATGAELARLKGEVNAVEDASIQKKCAIQFRKTDDPAS